MASILLLRLKGPMQSWGGVVVCDQHPTRDYPQRSALTGLLGNALGLDRADTAALERLQTAYDFAVRVDQPGKRMRDYHTADLGSPKMLCPAFFRDGGTAERGSGSATTGTAVKQMFYLADASIRVAVQFARDDDLHEAAAALRRPARPLFLGRKCAIPSSPVFDGIVDAANVLEALVNEEGGRGKLMCWPLHLGPQATGTRTVRVDDIMDYRNGVHAGGSTYYEGVL